jgi:hydroxysqualene synthase
VVTGLAEAYASCERTARAHYENFPVASLLLPKPLRPHVAAVYAFARSADDFADEGSLSAPERCTLLDGWLDRLRHATQGGSQAPSRPGEPANAPEIFQALGSTMREKALPPVLFEDLLSAFRQDVSVRRYESWSDVLDYCRRSANPVGRLVLRIAGYDNARLDAWSDAICSALQLANFWQDFRIDFERGRLYLPQSEVRAHGADERDLTEPSTPRAWRRAVAAAVARTEELFVSGRPLCDALGGRLRWELRATWLGGTRILRAIERADFDVMGRRPTLGASDLPWLAWRAATWVPR